jgi:hypothetical protein
LIDWIHSSSSSASGFSAFFATADFLILDVLVFTFLDGLLIAFLVFHRHRVIKRLQRAFGCALRAMGPAIFQCCVAVLSLCLQAAIAQNQINNRSLGATDRTEQRVGEPFLPRASFFYLSLFFFNQQKFFLHNLCV